MSSHTNIDVTTLTGNEHRQVRCANTLALGDLADLWQLEIHPVEADPSLVRIQNHGPPCQLVWHKRMLAQNESAVITLPAHVAPDDTMEAARLEIRRVEINQREALQTVACPTGKDDQDILPLDRLVRSPGPETLANWFTALQLLQRNYAGSKEFLNRAAEAVTNPGGMTGAIIVLREDDDWTIAGSHLPDPDMGIAFNRDLVERAACQRSTCYHDATQAGQLSSACDAAVASPIFDKRQNVVGAVFGYRSSRNQNKRRGIRAFEALWIQLVASSISAALGRHDAEVEAARSNLLLEQVFAPEVMKEIRHNPDALAGQERETTILFVDLRQSTAISEQLSTADTYKLLSEFLEVLTLQVMDKHGVIIDYYGDGLAAMWNAPTNQPDHARLACQAAQGIIRDVEKLSHQWQHALDEPLVVGVGINTGVCRVGNAGTKRRLKYGPRGMAMVLASRLESATKKLGTPILLGQSTVDRLGGHAATRRVCKATFAGITDPVDIYELCELDASILAEELSDFIDQYQQALELCDAGNLVEAERLLRQCAQSRTTGQSSAQFLLAELEEGRQLQRRGTNRTGQDRRQRPFVVDFIGRLDDDSNHPSI